MHSTIKKFGGNPVQMFSQMMRQYFINNINFFNYINQHLIKKNRTIKSVTKSLSDKIKRRQGKEERTRGVTISAHNLCHGHDKTVPPGG